ncbi:MAG: hemerythrin domain-containing protein [Burkholderiales bacterium]|nr:hemerythrin domain-containing protein [Pseudomonadota bacterium]MCC7067765.1 hemerythrin domain-containing protein [Burkholderiales bacterium]
MSTGRIGLPGFSSPAAGFDEPFAMLDACHERVRRSLGLLARLVDHVAAHGSDGSARGAAADVLRYFDLAAPRHHEDEELHVFPPLLASDDQSLHAVVQRLAADHALMHEAWGALRPLLQDVSAGADGVSPAALRDAAARFASLYGEHIALEEQRVYPAARAALDAAALRLMGEDMQRRRQAH